MPWASVFQAPLCFFIPKSQSCLSMPPSTRSQRLSWILYDWANSGFGLIVIGPLFSNYFIEELLPRIHGDDRGLLVFGRFVPPDAVFGVLTSISMALMAVAAPTLGAVADIRGWTKRLLILHAVTGSLLAMSMILLKPGGWLVAAILYVASNYCFGASLAFYNAYLPTLAPPEKQGRLSGWGFAAGYVGGAVALILAGLLPTRWGLFLAGAWWLAFSVPAFLTLKEFVPTATDGDHGSLLLAGFRRVGRTFLNIRRYKVLFLFLLAFLLYNDGIETVIAMSPAFGTEVIKMSKSQLITMFLIIQFVAFVGATVFGYLADYLGNKPVIVSNLVVWVIAAGLAFFVQTPGQFTLVGVLIGIVLGGVQASSRTLMGVLAPAQIRNEAFGFFSISGKFASILGPLVYSGLATAYGSRYGIFSVLPFMLMGLVVLLFVREPRPARSAVEPDSGFPIPEGHPEAVKDP